MLHQQKVVEIYTDGACSGNPGVGGWGAILRWKGHECELYGGEVQTTNNQMELMAALCALKALKESCSVDLYTDSVYVRNGISLWLEGWKKNNWQTVSRKTVKNKELWQALEDVCSRHTIRWHWIKGHAGHPDNERADALARKAIIEYRKNGCFSA
ncbi:ribonuclease HI [Bartonella koehlerae]|uniref:Ribonuclease H n=1 Tax=Bartonella koehlerae C-29 TaxID=1134510 RepID=A0A067W5Z6_9HYPH|nr:ribonuclease HI [Bartonella koehlerae]KEC55370.1 ribonuclease H [Bartonella koehlerae C-29]